MSQIRTWFWDSYQAALAVNTSPADVVDFITNPTHAFDYFLNDVKEGAVGLFTAVMTELTNAPAFDGSAQWWRDAYAATAGIGVVLLALSLMWSAHQYHRGLIGPAEAGRAFGYYPVLAMLMMVFGPPIGYVLSYVAGGLSEGLIAWMGVDSVEFLQRGAVFSGIQASTLTGGPIAGLLIFALLFIVLIGVLGTFVVQTVSAYILGVTAGAAWGLSANPRWRAKALAVPVTAATLIFARPATLLALGITIKMSNAMTTVDPNAGGIQPLVNAIIVIVALVMVAASPWILLKWMPMAMDAADSVRSGQIGAQSAMGSAGSTASNFAMRRARASADGGGSSAMMASGGSGGGSAGGGAMRAAASRSAARLPVGGGAKAGAAALGGAASGGALLAAHVARSGAQTAVRKAQAAADQSVRMH